MNIEIHPDGSFEACEHVRDDFNSMKLVGYRPDGRLLKVRMKDDTPDGTYWVPEAEIVVRTASGWSMWRYVLTILKTVLQPRTPPRKEPHPRRPGRVASDRFSRDAVAPRLGDESGCGFIGLRTDSVQLK